MTMFGLGEKTIIPLDISGCVALDLALGDWGDSVSDCAKYRANLCQTSRALTAGSPQ